MPTRRWRVQTPDPLTSVKSQEIARMEQRSMQSQMSVMLGDAIARYRPTQGKKASATR